MSRFYPKKFDNFPHLMQAYINKLPPGHPMLATRVSSKGTTVTYLKPLPQADYTPPTLTTLGRKLLGLDPWHSSDEAREERHVGRAKVGVGSFSPAGEKQGDGGKRKFAQLHDENEAEGQAWT